MNDKDAFKEWFICEDAVNEHQDQACWLAWQAALEYARGRQEPVACIGTNGELLWLNKPNALYSKAVPLYSHPAQPVQPAGAQGEQVAWMLGSHETLCTLWRKDTNMDTSKMTPLYAHPPADVVRELVEALMAAEVILSELGMGAACEMCRGVLKLAKEHGL